MRTRARVGTRSVIVHSAVFVMKLSDGAANAADSFCLIGGLRNCPALRVRHVWNSRGEQQLTD